MKEMIQRMREEKGGFTLAELLIVVAIVMVLVAIAIPVFAGAMDGANASTDEANIRSGWSQAQVYAMTKVDSGGNAVERNTAYYLTKDAALAKVATDAYVTKGVGAKIPDKPEYMPKDEGEDWTAGQIVTYTFADKDGKLVVTVKYVTPTKS